MGLDYKQMTSKSDHIISNNSDKSALRRSFSQWKKRASTNFTLSSIHASKVSKIVVRKASRRRRLEISAEHDDHQDQDFNTITSSLSSATIVLRRSNRLSEIEKRFDASKAGLAMDLSNSACSPFIVPRRSGRLLEQKSSQLNFRGHRVGNKFDTSSIVKYKGISKRQRSNDFRNRNKNPQLRRNKVTTVFDSLR